jgi:hypothetical protein
MFYQPLAAAILCFSFIVGRVLYTVGYLKTPNSRGFGALICDFAMLGLFALDLATIGKWLQFE